jgi:hypothetical protein
MVSIDVLPNDVLLEIFDFSANEHRPRRPSVYVIQSIIEAWHALVHVCRRWRSVVFGSPLRLNLELVCTAKTPARDMLDVWPPFLPLVIRSHDYLKKDGNFPTEGVDNIIAVLERSDRVRQIGLTDVPNSHLEDILAAVQRPLPELTHLRISSHGGPFIDIFIPDSFLSGSAPRLQFISLNGISFPGLPKLLLSATHLSFLDLMNIPHSGYISPEVMVTALSVMTRLHYLSLEFRSPQSFPDHESQRPPPLTRSVLPVLRSFTFKGVSEYLEYFVARIDAPRLNWFYITFFNQIIFDTPQSIQFVNRAPALKALEKAHVGFQDNDAMVWLSSLTSRREGLYVKIPCGALDWQVSSLEQVCTSSLPPLSALEDLYIYKRPHSLRGWRDNIENALWLELLHPFPAVKNLYLCKDFAPRIVPALQELVGGRTLEVLPTLQNIFLEELQPSGPVQEGIEQFVAVRQVTSHPIAVSLWDNSKQDKMTRHR